MDPKLDRREESSLDPNEIRGRFLDQNATRGMEMRPKGGVWTKMRFEEGSKSKM